MTHKTFNLETITTEFIQASARGDSDKLRNILAEDLNSYITNAQGGVNHLQGGEALIRNIEELDVKTVKPNIRITQILSIGDNQVMVMIEGNMKRKGNTFQNYAAYLLTFKQGQIKELQMVEAFPAESDAFWKS